MFTRISNFFKDLLGCSPLNASTPHVPHPPEQPAGSPLQAGDSLYRETSTDVEAIAGTQISFGTVESTVVDQDGNATHDRRKVGHILGDGLLVTSLEPRIEDGLCRPGVRGLCRFCLEEAIPDFEAGMISYEDLQRRSLFSTDSIVQCEGCRRKDVCDRHCQEFERFDGTKPRLCPACTKLAIREDRDKESLYTLLSPWLKQKKLPPSNGQEVQS